MLWASAEQARGRGQHLTLCTAHVAVGLTRGWAERLDPDGWHVFNTGASVWRPSTGEVLTTPLPDGALDAVARVGAARGWVVEAYAWDELAVDSDAELAVDHARLLGVEHRRRPLDSLDGPVVRAQLVVPIDDADQAIAATPEGCRGSGATSPSMPSAAFVSMTAAGVSKAAGIAAVAERMGVAMGEVMMVGDGNNDLPALEAVGWPVAIGDADSAVIAAARLVVAPVDDDGAAEAISRAAQLPGSAG